MAAVGLTPKEIGGSVTFAEANLTFVCKKLYQAPFERKNMAEVIDKGFYGDWEPRWMFIGEIVEVEDNR